MSQEVMSQEVKPIDEKHIAIIETYTSERLIAKATLETQKADYLNKIAKIDEMLLLFVKG